MTIADRFKTPLFFIVTILLTAAAIWWTFYTFVEFSGFAAALGKAVIGIIFFIAYDKVVLRKVDTITEIKKGNIAYAIFILSHALIIAACIAVA